MSQDICELLCPSHPSFCPFHCPPPPPPHAPPPPPHPPPRPPPPQPPSPTGINVIVAFLVGSMIFIIFSVIVVRHSSDRNIFRRSTYSVDNDTREDHGQSQNPSDHTQDLGLEESLINSITVCRYRRGGGLIEGSECSICLTEFYEDENLRLLPNCCHAFHLPCIDTWLRSNRNCPLCRTNIISNPMSSLSRNPSSSSDSEQATHIGNSDNQVGLGGNLNNGVGGNQSSANNVDTSRLGESASLHFNRRFRSHSDLGAVEMMDDDDIRLVRRSVSMISISSLANLFPTDSGESSSAIRGGATGDKKSHLNQLFCLKRNVLKQYLKRSFEGAFAQKRPASFSRLGRSQDSFLPL